MNQKHMNELMKRYEAETGRKPKDLFMGSEESLIHFTREYVEWLESQLTWRPVSEKPKENDEDYFTRSSEGEVVKMRYHDGKFFVFDDEVSAFFLPTQHPLKKPKYWLPIPPAPEGE